MTKLWKISCLAVIIATLALSGCARLPCGIWDEIKENENLDNSCHDN